MQDIQQILNMSSKDISKLSRQELARTVSVLASAGNKRLRRLEKTAMGIESIPYKNAMKVGNFSVKGKNQGQLQNEFKRVREFLQTKTSTVKGWKSEKKKVYQRIGKPFKDVQSEKAFWTAYRNIAYNEKALHHSYGSTETQRFLRTEQENETPLTKKEITAFKDLFPEDNRDLTNLNSLDLSVIRTLTEMGKDYELQEQEEQGRYGGTAGFFRIGGDDV